MRNAPSRGKKPVNPVATPLSGHPQATWASKGVTTGAWSVTQACTVDPAPDAVLRVVVPPGEVFIFVWLEIGVELHIRNSAVHHIQHMNG